MRIFILTQINSNAKLLYAKAFPTKEEAKAEMKRQYEGVLAASCEEEETKPSQKGFKDKESHLAWYGFRDREAHLVWYYENEDLEEILQWNITESEV